ncbi:MAG TPA: hypothetical protein VGG89_10620 [Candidatus Baltobacteraceae bacterium]|jgi:hypothetical protein
MRTSLARVVRGTTDPDRGLAPLAQPAAEPELDQEAIELANASIVAAALGLGIYIETLV